MIFTTWPFLVFMLFVFVTYWWVVPARRRRDYLLLTSLAYFTYNYPPHTLLLGALTLATYLIGRLIFFYRERENAPDRAKAALVAGLVLCAGALVFFKYSKLLVSSFNGIAERADLGGALPVPNFLIPLGISFFTFEFIHYLVDLYHGRVKKVGLRDYALFAFFFPSLVSGPVKRFQIFQQQTEEVYAFRPDYAAEGLRRIALGIAKKLIIADTASIFTYGLLAPDSSPRAVVWAGMYAYAVKIYYDFSGYTDIAIGCGLLLGYRLPENFDSPYKRANLSKFWNNWHMSLSTWIRDYLFFPLGGSRAAPLRVAFNLTVVMAICGIWHGANWNFLVWGLWHGVGLAALRVYQQTWGKNVPDTRVVRWLSVFVTFQFVCLGWVLFAAPDLPTALAAFRKMF